MTPTWKAVIGIILVFILGWFGGALTTLVIAHHQTLVLAQHDPEQVARMLERGALRGVDLDDDKRKQIHSLIVENVRQRVALQKQIQPQVKSIDRQTLDQVNALLTPDQQGRFEENLQRLKQRFGRNPFPVDENEQPATAATATAPAH